MGEAGAIGGAGVAGGGAPTPNVVRAMSTKQVAMALGVDPKTVRRWVRGDAGGRSFRGELAPNGDGGVVVPGACPVKIAGNGDMLFCLEEVRAWMLRAGVRSVSRENRHQENRHQAPGTSDQESSGSRHQALGTGDQEGSGSRHQAPGTSDQEKSGQLMLGGAAAVRPVVAAAAVPGPVFARGVVGGGGCGDSLASMRAVLVDAMQQQAAIIDELNKAKAEGRAPNLATAAIKHISDILVTQSEELRQVTAAEHALRVKRGELIDKRAAVSAASDLADAIGSRLDQMAKAFADGMMALGVQIGEGEKRVEAEMLDRMIIAEARRHADAAREKIAAALEGARVDADGERESAA